MNTDPEKATPESLPAVRQDWSTPAPAQEMIPELRSLPKEVGVMLLSAGVVGFVMPGPGTPAIIAGGLVLWPEGFGRVEGWVQRRFPTMHRTGLKQVHRYLKDLDRRYPWSKD
ncbi:MAG: hypothetical protein P4L84_35375 [Isosphaeraceae bacterium]|nr:hypothetical protein [Isosphaeraceae bacterium]MDR3660484.1 hypothetical protein [Mycobacterium sp.]